MHRLTVIALIALAILALTGAGPTPARGDVQATPVADGDVTHCLLLDNHGACVNCCKDATGLPGNPCSHFCNWKKLPPPPPEPQP